MSNDPSNRMEIAGEKSPHFTVEEAAVDYAAWEEVDAGRFMPRRVRGSCQGRALG